MSSHRNELNAIAPIKSKSMGASPTCLSAAICVEHVSFHYPARKETPLALKDVSFRVDEGQICALLGPNGSGKSTLFRLLATLLPWQQGTGQIFGVDLAHSPQRARRLFGVTFQSPSLDTRLTVEENLWHQGKLYGLSSIELQQRILECSTPLGLKDWLPKTVETLSGGWKRRVELAKALLHHPRLLLLDEPSVGLDPGSRRELWQELARLRQMGISILVSTHLMEEAELADHVVIFDQGQKVAEGSPDELTQSVGQDALSMTPRNPETFAEILLQKTGRNALRMGSSFRLEGEISPGLVEQLATSLGPELRAIGLVRPTLEEVFLKVTGRTFESADQED
ncbi:Daunorubicin/doxorubicin resistance ATP-binding protein DrrA [Planctopirus ephydatiae]|uniref:Daunorubicin/doxorubicin resistance ATP-binding protein DrrA n=2 Tax=Planctopirus ephydatiae TaxID=2528019 RepID=A0A518GII2_9PLAN|nr:Daunorubicin/doxorubicin resistance ATP-binding protein DrrA [Planctopirus ephydatiae]